MYAANASMADACLANADGDFLLVPQQGRLRLVTEMGVLEVAPKEIAVVPRGVRFAVELPDGPSRCAARPPPAWAAFLCAPSPPPAAMRAYSSPLALPKRNSPTPSKHRPSRNPTLNPFKSPSHYINPNLPHIITSNHHHNSGYVLEIFQGAFSLPDLGPIGANGLAAPRDFLTPVARFEERACAFTVVHKFEGKLFAAAQAFSPFNVVAWHGNHVPYKYDLRRFCPMNAVSFGGRERGGEGGGVRCFFVSAGLCLRGGCCCGGAVLLRRQSQPKPLRLQPRR